MSDCVFCRIVAKQIPATVVHEDEETLAFMDIGQVNPGHVLVAVKKHAENLYALDDAQAARGAPLSGARGARDPRRVQAGRGCRSTRRTASGRPDRVPFPRAPGAAA